MVRHQKEHAPRSRQGDERSHPTTGKGPAPPTGTLHHTDRESKPCPENGSSGKPGTRETSALSFETLKAGSWRTTETAIPSRPARGQAQKQLRHTTTNSHDVIHKYTVGQLHPEHLRSIRTGTGPGSPNFGTRPGRLLSRHSSFQHGWPVALHIGRWSERTTTITH